MCWRTAVLWASEQSEHCFRGPQTKTPAPLRLCHTGAHPDLTWLCNEFYGSSSCAQTTQGCIWLFPGANTTRWHRDYDEDWQLLTGKQVSKYLSRQVSRATYSITSSSSLMQSSQRRPTTR